MVTQAQVLESDPSPRSTIIRNSALMTTTLPVMNASNMASDVVGADDEKMISSPKEVAKEDAVAGGPSTASSSPKLKGSSSSDHRMEAKPNPEKDGTSGENYFPPTPTPHDLQFSQGLGYPVTLTPQAGSAYHYQTYSQQHMTPESPSPAGHYNVNDVYNVGSFFHQPQAGAFAAPHPSPFGSTATGSSTQIHVPMSPPRGVIPTVAITMAGSIPPASPLFPRATSGHDIGAQQRGAPPSPSIPYMMSPQLAGTSTMYHTYPAAGVSSRSSEEMSWGAATAERYVDSNSMS